mgnify:CR=1 FL=1
MSDLPVLEVTPLLDDGACSMRVDCLNSPSQVRAKCPQSRKCGTCVAWTPREANGYSRISGQCMLNKEARTYLDCNANICPYYSPRRENPAFAEHQTLRKAPKSSGRRRRVKMDRESPPPSPQALATVAFQAHDPDVADIGAAVLTASLVENEPLPVLLERFRGGTAKVSVGDDEREAPMEAFYARLVQVKSALDALSDAITDSALTDDEKSKINKDLGGIGGSLTTFNVLFKDKADHFKGQGK